MSCKEGWYPLVKMIRQTVEVAFHYPVHFTNGLFAYDNPLLHEVLTTARTGSPKKLLVVADEGVIGCHSNLLSNIEAYIQDHSTSLWLVGPPLVVEGGEGVKNTPRYVQAIHDAVNRYGLDRQSFIIAVGGGAMLDMAGYAAATAHRGVRLVRVPTTVLSQNDSGVGVKNSMNAFNKKNFLGTFAPPYAVLNDFAFLTTLSDRDWLGGVSEAIKVALLKDPAFFEFIEQHTLALLQRDMKAMQHIIYRCAELHLQHIATSGDAFEQGSSRPLDFGHWAAHKLEALSNYQLRHGEAVAIGIALDTTYAYLAGLLQEEAWNRILTVFQALGLLVHVTELNHEQSLLSGLEEFREHLGGRLTVMLLEGIGKGTEVHYMNEDTIVKSIRLLKSYEAHKGVAA